jgi:hypothetical protein
MFDPVYLGCDLYGSPVMMTLAHRKLLPGEVGCPTGANDVARDMCFASG